MSNSKQDALSQDVVFDLLSNPRRRFVLSYLRRQDEPVEIGELASQIAAWENDTEPEELTSQQRKRVYVSIYQTHIPKLEEAGVVEYDSDTGMVRAANRAGEVDRYLHEPERRPWRWYYLAVAGAGAILYALVVAGVPGFDALPESGVGLVVVLAVAGLAVAQFLTERRR